MASPAHPVGVYGKRKAVYNSFGKVTFSLKYENSSQEKFQIYGEEECIEVNEIKILRALRNMRGGSAGCSANYEINVDSKLRCEKENTKFKSKSKIFIYSNNDKMAPEVTHLKSGTVGFIFQYSAGK